MLHIAVDGRLLAYSNSGISEYTRQLVTQMAPMLHATERLTMLHSARRARPELGVLGVRYARALTPPHHSLEQISLPIELARLSARVVHSPDFIPPLHGPWRRAITVHDLAFLLYPETVTPASREYYGQVRKAVQVADAVISVSHHTAADITAMLDVDPARVHVIPNGIDPRLMPVSDPAVLGRWRATHGLDRPYILFAGTIEPRKNLPLLAEAFACLREEHDVMLVLLGARGWLYEPTFERIQSLGIGEHVRILEQIPRQEWATAYSGAAVAVTPSIYEGFGLPVLEAMVCGAPVVSSDASSLPEVVGEAGLLFRSGDRDDLVRALKRVLEDDDLRARLQTAGHARVKEFSWQKAAAATLDVYRRIAQ
ncbi:MAG: glycosyltransferase family 4 protein [Chloroflexota bacterium]